MNKSDFSKDQFDLLPSILWLEQQRAEYREKFSRLSALKEKFKSARDGLSAEQFVIQVHTILEISKEIEVLETDLESYPPSVRM